MRSQKYMTEPYTTAYEFGPFRLDPAARRLLRDGVPVPLTAKLFDILLLLVRSRGEVVTKETLMREIWSDSFVEENNLTVSISSLRKSLGERYREREYIETVTKRGYRFVAEVRKVRGAGAGRADSGRPRGDARGRAARGEAVGALAVLPFLNVGEGRDLEYLSDGLTEQIIISLSRLPRLRVMARSTVFRYKGREPDARQVGRELNVDAVLLGRLREFDGRLLLGVEMVDVSDGSQLWGETYSRPLSDLFRVQEEIAAELSERLRVELTSEERERLTKPRTEDSEVYHLYLKGRYFWNKRTLEDIERGARYFEECLGRDPDYAPAHAGLADCYLTLIFLNALPANEGFPAVRREAAKALALDETLAEAHTSLGYVEMMSLNWPEAEREFRRAIELNPNSAQARGRYSLYLALWGRTEEAVAQVERALANDPLSPRTHITAANVFYYTRRYERAVEHCRQALEIEPRFGAAYGVLGLVYERQGMYDEAISEMRRARGLLGSDPEPLGILGYLYAVSGRRREAKRVLNEVLKLSEQKYVPPFFVACIHAGLGEREKAFEWLERAFEERAYLPTLAIFPFFDGLRPDPRFADLLRRSGFPS